MAQRAKIGINGDLLGFDEQLDRIQTPGIGGGSVIWLPEADTRCETLNVTANGTYSAQLAGKYGYDYVTVSVPGSSVTGKDPATGEEVVVRPDPETGEIEKTVVPVEIRVTTPPTKEVYSDGETVDVTGMVVKAYGANGDEMQTVPVGEITINPTVAVYDESKDPGGRRGTATLDGVSIDYAAGVIHCDYPAIVSSFEYCVRVTESAHRYYKRTNEPIDILYYAIQTEQFYPVRYGGQTPGGVQYYTAYFDVGSSELPIIPPMSISDIAEILYDGTHEEEPAGSPQTITVSWPRPGDGAVLETSFNITVTGGEDDEQP